MPRGLQGTPETEVLRAELAEKKAMLADIRSGNLTLGRPFEDHEVGIQRRITELENLIIGHDAPRT